MAIFCVEKRIELTSLVDEFGTTVNFEQCLCAMFGFKPSFLHISKDVTYDASNKVSKLFT
jgi:hypothetical protein